ncbi:MAG: hypothetical protein ACOY8P_03555 [Thermodesulfobacteriota bacterium]
MLNHKLVLPEHLNRYGVTVFANDTHTGAEEAVFSTTVTFVRIDRSGHKLPLR